MLRKTDNSVYNAATYDRGRCRIYGKDRGFFSRSEAKTHLRSFVHVSTYPRRGERSISSCIVPTMDEASKKPETPAGLFSSSFPRLEPEKEDMYKCRSVRARTEFSHLFFLSLTGRQRIRACVSRIHANNYREVILFPSCFPSPLFRFVESVDRFHLCASSHTQRLKMGAAAFQQCPQQRVCCDYSVSPPSPVLSTEGPMADHRLGFESDRVAPDGRDEPRGEGGSAYHC